MPKVKYLGGATGAIQVDEVVLEEGGEAVEVTAEQLERLKSIDNAQLEIDGRGSTTPSGATAPVQSTTSSSTSPVVSGGGT